MGEVFEFKEMSVRQRKRGGGRAKTEGELSKGEPQKLKWGKKELWMDAPPIVQNHSTPPCLHVDTTSANAQGRC